MMQKKIALSIFIYSISLFPLEKHVIGSRDAGFFSNFIGVLNHLVWCKENNKIPFIYWDKHNYYYQPTGYNGSTNVWEYYFEQVSDANYQKEESIDCNFTAPDRIYPKNFSEYLNTESRLSMYATIERYIKIIPTIKKKIEDFYNRYMAGKKTVGIHIRGTDKYTEAQLISVKTFIKKVKKFRKKYQFFIATDEQPILEYFINNVKASVLFYPSHRSYNGRAIHYDSSVCPEGKALLGEEILIETKLLSMCDIFVHGNSNVALGVLFFNPWLKNIYISGKEKKNFWKKIKSLFV